VKLFTVGYEGCEVREFVDFLASKKIQQVVDIRKNPLSRKKGFSKNKLAESLKQKKIAYLHVGALGVPSAWRKLAKQHFITREKMFSDYVGKILPAHQKELDEIYIRAKASNVALLCYEADALDCHRNYAAQNLRKQNRTLRVVHLFPKGEAE
jgi:uncharacterized protein (DUF488 family)